MRAILLSYLLIFHPCSAKKAKEFDFGMAMRLLRSYFCTGDMNWYKKIENDPALKYMMHVAIIYVCDNTQFRKVQTLRGMVKEANSAFQYNSWEKRARVSNCLWKGIKEWHFIPFLCPVHSEIFMENYYNSIDEIWTFLCPEETSGSWNLWWKIGEQILKNKIKIREVLKPYVCANHRLKRQFDAKSVVAIFKQNACLQSAAYTFDYVAIEKGQSHYFSVFGHWCCFIELVKT